MRSLRPILWAVMSLSLAGKAWGATECQHAYEKVFPYDAPLGNEQAYINVHSEVLLSYDCQAAKALAAAEARAGIFDLELNLLQAEAVATAQQGQPATARARVLVMGFEVAREDLDLDQMVDLSISPEPEVDVSGTLTLNVGPVPVPIKYGVTTNAQLHIQGGTKGFGVALSLVPAASAQVYVQAGLDIAIAEAIARGDVVLLDDQLNNEIALTFEDSDRGYIRFDASSRNSLRALSGHVLVRAKAGLGPFSKSYERDLLRWDGLSQDQLLFDYSDRVAILN
ncbi:MAG TPA: hypothetical protein VE954_28105 [Oligoflexus sp.]|uniref:hypothetical protein n=1 Tax=Oligoflexus sp. TaxID=1971216 RepID=UPI002D298DA2|nr:hypothetical protein [Oligoflexus sp.]HYX36982.1 hypothetical protein [Oligoflexus sp.]